MFLVLALFAVLIIAKLIVKKMHSMTSLHWMVTADFKEDQLGHPFNAAGLQASTHGAECPLV